MASEEKTVTVFGVECVDRYGFNYWTADAGDGLQVIRMIHDVDGTELVGIRVNGTTTLAGGQTIADAERNLIADVRRNTASCQRFLEMFGGE